MKFLWSKRNYFLGLIIILLLFCLFFLKGEDNIKSVSFDGKRITFIFKENVRQREVYNKIDKIYHKYDNYSKKLNGKLDSDMHSFLEYGKILYGKTNGIIDITGGEYDSKLKNYKLGDDTLSDKINFNISGILASYATSEVIDYFDLLGIKKYIVNIDGDVIAGYSKDGFNISLHDTDNSLLKVVSFSDKSISSMNNKKSTFGDGLYDGIWVISDDILTSNMLSNYLYYLSIEDGKEVSSKFGSEALWYKDGEFYMTENFSNYFVKKL